MYSTDEKTKVWVDYIPEPEESPFFQELSNRVYPEDDGSLPPSTIETITFYNSGEVYATYLDGSNSLKSYIKTELDAIPWQPHVCSTGFGIIRVWEIYESDGQSTNFSIIYDAVGVCNGIEIRCTLLSDNALGDMVFEKTEGGCEEYSFGF